MAKENKEKYIISDEEIKDVIGGVVIDGTYESVYDLIQRVKARKLPKATVKYMVFHLWNTKNISTDQSQEDFDLIEKFIDDNWDNI